MSGALPTERVKELFDVCRAGDFDAMGVFAKNILADGFPVSQVRMESVH